MLDGALLVQGGRDRQSSQCQAEGPVEATAAVDAGIMEIGRSRSVLVTVTSFHYGHNGTTRTHCDSEKPWKGSLAS